MQALHYNTLAEATSARAEARLKVEALSKTIFQLKREDPRPNDFEERRHALNADMRLIDEEIQVIEACIEDLKHKKASERTDVKRFAIESNMRQAELARERDREKTHRHNEAREEKMRTLVELVRMAAPVLARSADPEAAQVIGTIQEKAPWIIRIAS